ncbi:aspartate aminotransferase family protein [Gordonia jinhuaensis]|uniref:Aspartate aminotransferase family protein n=1 Tax=Gordonia jinhuaensis TaxID=1517702 RepID=A0A916WYC9_9ACTN|nr:aspartate aminotransferase family protein [Gordonia jinhuaensis]GGB40105.1 aspartate aminotransferase family protein [Gordonia jinhuaensis]
MPAPTTPSAKAIYDKDRSFVFHSWSAQSSVDPLVITGADGVHVIDGDGNRLLDFSSQLVYTNIGHQHPKVVAAVAEQAHQLCTIAPAHANEARARAAELIIDIAPEGFRKVFFTNGGADAVEHAIRMARLTTGRYKTLSAFRGYHGATQQAINLTGDPRRWPSDYGSAGSVHFFAPFLYRSQFNAETDEQECERALAHLRSLIEFEGPAGFAAIILESIPGTAGIMPPPAGYLAGVRALCDEFGIVMILDEVMAGFGRTGKWLALEHFDAVPDLITFAKGVNSGYVPLGGVMISERIADEFATRAYPGGLTYSGHPLACAAAVATIETMHDEHVVDNAALIGETVLGPGLAELAERHPVIGDVRGLGVFWAIELVADRDTKEPLAPYGGSSPAMAAIASRAQRNGLLMFQNMNRFHLTPPCIVSAEETKQALAILDDALCAL